MSLERLGHALVIVAAVGTLALLAVTMRAAYAVIDAPVCPAERLNEEFARGFTLGKADSCR